MSNFDTHCRANFKGRYKKFYIIHYWANSSFQLPIFIAKVPQNKSLQAIQHSQLSRAASLCLTQLTSSFKSYELLSSYSYLDSCMQYEQIHVCKTKHKITLENHVTWWQVFTLCTAIFPNLWRCINDDVY